MRAQKNTMFVDELTITAKAGSGGNGVIRWRREKFVDRGGPAGGNGGRGGDVILHAVRDINRLASYTGSKEFHAEDGKAGAKRSQYGHDGEDLVIEIPMGSTVTDIERSRVYTLEHEGDREVILRGGRGGLGNEYFKSATERAPEIATDGKRGEAGTFKIEVALRVDAGFIGLPNAGKSTLLNTLTRANARVGAYPFTTLEPHLGDFYGYIFADIPGLIEGASEGKGLGHAFLKHIERTRILFHCVSLENEDPRAAYETVMQEIREYNKEIAEKETFIILTKSDLADSEQVFTIQRDFEEKTQQRVFVISCENGEGIEELKKQISNILNKTQ